MKHGKRNTRLYHIWRGIKERTLCITDKAYRNYGGRGITICDEWRNNFKTFYDWAMSNGYSDNLTIDRIDVNGNYEPTNCRWVNMKTQGNNRRTNRLLSYNGETMTMQEWSVKVGLSKETLSYRLNNGWNIEEALQAKTKPYKKLITYCGETKSLQEWADTTGLTYSQIKQRIYKYHWSVEKALSTKENLNFRLVTLNGRTQSLKEWANDLGIKYKTVQKRIYCYNWSIEDALTKPVTKRNK